MRGRIKYTKEDKGWAERVKLRDDRKCVICSSTERPNAHHILPREIKEYKHDTRNGITLCPRHHRFSRVISPHQNPIAFIKWLQINRPLQYILAMRRCDS